MKKTIIYILITLLFSSFSPYIFATENKLINREDAFIFFAQYYQDEVPESFQYINLLYTDVEADSQLEDALQVLVYLNLIKNVATPLFPEKKISILTLEQFAEKIIQVKISNSQNSLDKKKINATTSDLEAIYKLLEQRKTQKEKSKIIINQNISGGLLGEKEAILQDVYKTLTKSHYDKDNFKQDQLIQGAIQGLAAGSGDKYTRYFPPVESGNFFEGLSGEYEGIGAYVDMPAPGDFIIVSPMVGSPAEAAGLKGGDKVTHVDGKEITEKNSLKEVVSWIKGPAGTTVELTVTREGEKKAFFIKIKRKKIILKDVEYKKIDNKTFYIQIKNFGEHVDTEFQEAIEALKKDSSIKKIIFDLRNNPGGYLGEVSNILSFFIKKGEATAVVNYGKKELQYTSLGFNLLDLTKYKIILLQNSGTASASEIMIGTIKDYFPSSTIIGEQSFGKGSVQSLKKYYDGSSLKYTVAKWFTGKTKKGIDGVGITPDIELEFDSEKFKTEEKDNQLEKALEY